MTLFDYLVIGITGFFTLLGLVRGFIRELSSLISWLASALLTVLLRPIINDVISQKISNPTLSNIISSFLIFIIAIIALSILISNIAKAINTKFPSSINITLGLAFGFTKGFLISSLIFATILNMFGDTNDLSSKSGPKWLQDSETYRPLSFGAYLILPFANSIFGEIKEKYNATDVENKKTDNIEEDNLDEKNKIETLRRYKDGFDSINEILDRKQDIDESQENGNNETQKTNNAGGYKKDQIDKLNHLIDII